MQPKYPAKPQRKATRKSRHPWASAFSLRRILGTETDGRTPVRHVPSQGMGPTSQSDLVVGLEEAISNYLQARNRYRALSTASGQPSFTVIEGPKIEIADALLRLLRLPVGTIEQGELAESAVCA